MSAVVIYDQECPLCVRAVEWLKRRVEQDALECLPCQSSERVRRFPDIALETCMEAMQFVAPDGRVYAAEQALPQLCELLRGWRWLARALRLPGASLFSGPVYRFIARHRQEFSVIVARKLGPSADCAEQPCATTDEGS